MASWVAPSSRLFSIRLRLPTRAAAAIELAHGPSTTFPATITLLPPRTRTAPKLGPVDGAVATITLFSTRTPSMPPCRCTPVPEPPDSNRFLATTVPGIPSPKRHSSDPHKIVFSTICTPRVPNRTSGSTDDPVQMLRSTCPPSTPCSCTAVTARSDSNVLSATMAPGLPFSAKKTHGSAPSPQSTRLFRNRASSANPPSAGSKKVR